MRTVFFFSAQKLMKNVTVSTIEIGHEIISMTILSLPLIEVGQLSVSGERMCTKC